MKIKKIRQKPNWIGYKFLYVFLISIFCINASFVPSEIATAINDAKLVGSGKYSWLFLDIYEAQLFSKNGIFKPDLPFALKLIYLRQIKKEDIVDNTIIEMKKQGFKDDKKLKLWQEQLLNIFPNIEPFESLSGICDENGNTYFYFNGKIIAKISDKEFGRRFFDIWLSNKTSAPYLRKKLINEQ